MKTNVKFAKVRSDAEIPSKRPEDMGFDIYACFDEDYIEFFAFIKQFPIYNTPFSQLVTVL